VEIFYDTKQYHLMQSNIWLKQVGKAFSLKRSTESMSIAVKYKEEIFDSLEAALRSLPNKYEDVKAIHQFPVVRYRTTLSPEVDLQFDIAQFATEDFYSVATLAFKDVPDAALQLPWMPDKIKPVHSKIIDYLFHYQPAIYGNLLTLYIVPQWKYTSRFLYNHYSSLVEATTMPTIELENETELAEIDRYLKELGMDNTISKKRHQNLAEKYGQSMYQHMKEYYEYRTKCGLLKAS